MRNLYQVLGTTAQADDSQLKSAYRNLAKTYHPDINAGNRRAEVRFKELNQAYEVLRDPGARAAYDAFLADKQTGARRRIGNAALTVSASVLSAAVCLSLMVWLQDERPYLRAKQEPGGPSGNVTVAVGDPFSAPDGPPAQKTGEENAMPSVSPSPEPGGVVQVQGEEALHRPIAETGAETAPRDPIQLQRNDDVIGSKGPLAVEPKQRNDIKRATILDRASRQTSDKARKASPAKAPVVEGDETGARNRIAKVSASPPPAGGSDKSWGWQAADEPFIGPGGTGR